MQSPQPLISKPVKWRLWHAFTSFVGGATFLTASFLLFHTLDLAVDTEDISAALFVVGSLAFLAATIMESLHYHHSDYRYLSQTVLRVIKVLAAFCYLVGSVRLIPSFDRFDQGLNLFMAASVLLAGAQIWKLLENFLLAKSISDIFGSQLSQFLVDLFLEAGALLYLWGAFVFKKTDDEPQLMSKAVLLFSLGGLCFFTSATYLHKLYFWQATSQKLASDEMDSSAGIEM